MLAFLLDMVSRRTTMGFGRRAFFSTKASMLHPRASTPVLPLLQASSIKQVVSLDEITLAAINGTAFTSPALQMPLLTNDGATTTKKAPNFPTSTTTATNDTSTAATTTTTPVDATAAEPLAPLTNSDFNVTIPKILSPSALKEFENCPQSFFFQYILKLKQPTNTALAKGSMCHTALEHFLDLPLSDRNLTVLHNLYRKAWAQSRDTDTYKDLFSDVSAERDWGREGLACLSRYYDSEPEVAAPNPVQRETWVRATLAENITVRGIVDRLDLVRDEGDVVMRLMDYKTGKAPALKYSPAMNAKIEREAWDQLVLYSLLLRESKNTPIRFLRLIYLGDEDGATVWDKRLEQADMDAMKAKIFTLWADIVRRLESEDPFRAFEGCNRNFCYCHKCRPRFAATDVWQPPVLGE